MPTTRQGAIRRQNEEDVEDDMRMEENYGGRAAADETVISGSSAKPTQSPQVPTEQFFASLMETITRVQAEANRNLLTSLFNSAAAGGASGNFRTSSPILTPSTSTASSAAVGGNFSRCTARFNGAAHDGEVLEAFLDAVDIYKEYTAVIDEHALRGLPMLLEGEAAIWWRGVKLSVASWTDAVSWLRTVYGVTQPAHKIFRDIFAVEQQDCERGEVFLCRLRELVAKLLYKLPETAAIDIVYGLLHRRVKKRVQRECVTTLDELLCKVRIAEDAVKECKEVRKPIQASANLSKHSPRISPTTGAISSSSVNSNTNTVSSTSLPRKNHTRCKVLTHARIWFGRTTDLVRRRTKFVRV